MALSSRRTFPSVQSNPNSTFAESYRFIQTNIELSSSLKGSSQTLLITSAKPGEGKTSTAANLAITFAESGKRVLLVDADIRNPQLHHRFRISAEQGLSDILSEGKEIHTAICITEIPDLSLLPGGTPHHNASGLLSSLRFSSIIRKLRSMFDLVIIDGSSVLTYSDPLIVARNVDSVILVVDSKSTNRMAAQQAVASIRRSNENITGVLNRAPKRSKNSYYLPVTETNA